MLQIYKKISVWFVKQAKKETTLFPKTKFSFSFKPFHIYQGIVIIVLVFVVGSLFVFKPAVDKSLVLKTAITKPISAVVAGQPIKYTLLVKKSDIAEGQYLAQLPKSAENIQVNTISLLPGEKILTQTRPINTLTLGQRKILAERIKPKQFLASTIDGFNFLFADLEKAISHIVEQVGKPAFEITRTGTAVFVDLLPKAGQDQEYVAVEYEIEPTNIEAQDTKTGKRVIISSTEEPNQPELTDVIAYSVIPEIYNVGQESKIKIKWKGNNLNMPFNAFDLDNNGKIDYVEWLVPHLSTQTFEIIFISKALRLDSDKNITEDIYEKVSGKQDGKTTIINSGDYIKVTFQKDLNNENDITIYAKPTGANVKIDIFAEDGTTFITSFREISKNEISKYKVLLTELKEKSDTFLLKFTGGAEVDYIVDPAGACYGVFGETSCSLLSCALSIAGCSQNGVFAFNCSVFDADPSACSNSGSGCIFHSTCDSYMGGSGDCTTLWSNSNNWTAYSTAGCQAAIIGTVSNNNCNQILDSGCCASNNCTWDAAPPTITPSAQYQATSGNCGAYTFGNYVFSYGTCPAPGVAGGITVTLACDDGAGSGCASTYICTDTTNTCQPNVGASSVNVTTQGISYVRYWGDDVATNATATASLTIKLDTVVPSVNVGADQTKKAQFTQDATTSDASSGIASYQWSKVSGSGTITFGTATAEDTTISADTDGAYVIRLSVTDTVGNVGTDDFNLTWDTTPPAPLSFSPASASTIDDTTQTITFTTNEAATCKVSLTDQAYGDMTGDACTGGGTTSQSCTTPDLGSDGSKSVYIACIDTATNADTADTNENLTYTLSTDSANPTVSAGDDRVESSEFTQTGTASDDKGIATYAWSMVSGPGTISFGSASSVATTISASGVGTYVIRLTVTDTASKSTSDDFTLTFGSSVVGSGISSQPAVANQPSTTNQAITQAQAQEQVSNITQQITELVGVEKQITYPPISESVTEEAPIALQGWDVMELKSVDELLLNPMDSSLGFFTAKIPQFGNTLTAFGIDSKNTGDLAKISDAQLYLPGLSQIVATTKTIPTDIVFAMSAGELIDHSMAILVDENGNIKQRLETIAGKSMDLVIKPEKPAKRVTGYITLKKSGLGQASNNKVLGYITRFLTAGLISSIDNTNSNVLNGESLLLGKFSYAETSPGVFKASVQSPANEGEYEINTVIEYQDVLLAPKETSMTAIVNPEGYVYADNPDGRTRIRNASVTLLWLNPESSQYELWPADKFLQQNPVITDETGKYSFLVPEGTYKIKAEANNYLPFESGAFVMKEKIGISVDIKFERKPGTFSWPVLQTWHYIIILLSTIIIAVIIVIIIKGRRKNINSFG